MDGSESSGRVDLGSLLAGVLGGAVVAGVVLLALPARERETQALGPAPSDPALAELAAAVGRLERKLTLLESAPAPHQSTSERKPVPVHEGEADPVPLSKTEELHEDLRQLEARLDMLTAAWKEHDKPTFELPTLEQIHAARRDVDWIWLGQLAELYLKDEGAAMEKARLMTFEQLLKRVGVPDGITRDNGMWMYFRPEHVEGKWRGVYFAFVGDSVSSVRTDK